jgi:hypothetical protein
MHCCRIGRWSRISECWIDQEGYAFKPTHWMSLPDGPQEASRT